MKDCTCLDPLIPVGRRDEQGWAHAHHLNKEEASSVYAQNVDVVFFGDSITEGWRGKKYGNEVARAEGAKEVFESLFSKAKGGKYDGLALGIAADTVRTWLGHERERFGL
jgi:lysophospholipase L1-like esterase